MKQASRCSTREPKASGGCNHREPRQRRAPPSLDGAAVKTGDPLLGNKRKKLLPAGPPWGRKGKESTCQCRSLRSIPGSGRSPGEGTHSSILPGEFHGQRSLAGYSPRGRKELDTAERLNNDIPAGQRDKADRGGVLLRRHIGASRTIANRIPLSAARELFSWDSHTLLSTQIRVPRCDMGGRVRLLNQVSLLFTLKRGYMEGK